MPDPPFAVLESLLCSETLSPDSPTGSLITTGSFLEERRSRILLMDYDETLYGERALVQKLLDQKISLDVSCWGKVIRTRRDCWHRAYQVIKHGSANSGQCAGHSQVRLVEPGWHIS
jgi:hypothetical protein